MERHGRQKGTKELIELLQLGRVYGQEKLRMAIERAIALGCSDSAAVRHLLTTHELVHIATMPLDIGALAAFERPVPAVTEYDQLLVGGKMS